MDIDEYLKKKKELEKRKEILEAKNELDKKKGESPKKEVEIKRRREITTVDDEPRDPRTESYEDRYNRRYNNSSSDNVKWAFLGLAFFVALLILGFFFMTNYLVKNEVKDIAAPSNLGDLEKKIENLEKALNENDSSAKKEEDTNESKDKENETEVYTGPGPEFEMFLMDEYNDEVSIGVFDSAGKVAGKLIELWFGSGESVAYKYRLFIKNTEKVSIQCKIDELIEIDTNEDGEIDETKYDNKLAVLNLEVDEEQVMKRAVTGVGLIKGEYEGLCYFCVEGVDPMCSEIHKEGETKATSKFRVLIHAQSYGNQTNSTT